MLADLLDRLLGLPTSGVYTVIGVLAAVENIFPPVPADTAVGIGAFLSVGGRISAWSIFWITWVANVTTAALVYAVARTAGRGFFRGKLGGKLLSPAGMARIEALYARHGTWAIFFSRFIPAVRAIVPPFAGIAGLGAVRALVPMAAASAIWYGTITYLAATVVKNVEQIGRLVSGLNRGAAVLLAVVAAIVVFVAVRARRAKLDRAGDDR
ncbi:MAG TPA: VTT domain-containing protein [Gemmatimonadales bacterium]